MFLEESHEPELRRLGGANGKGKKRHNDAGRFAASSAAKLGLDRRESWLAKCEAKRCRRSDLGVSERNIGRFEG